MVEPFQRRPFGDDALDAFGIDILGDDSAHDVLDLRLLAYDLTAREREITTALLDGSDTRAVSQRLFLSPHTVNDHLKAIFAKVGVRTRKELTAMLAAPPREPAPEARPGA